MTHVLTAAESDSGSAHRVEALLEYIFRDSLRPELERVFATVLLGDQQPQALAIEVFCTEGPGIRAIMPNGFSHRLTDSCERDLTPDARQAVAALCQRFGTLVDRRWQLRHVQVCPRAAIIRRHVPIANSLEDVGWIHIQQAIRRGPGAPYVPRIYAALAEAARIIGAQLPDGARATLAVTPHAAAHQSAHERLELLERQSLISEDLRQRVQVIVDDPPDWFADRLFVRRAGDLALAVSGSADTPSEPKCFAVADLAAAAPDLDTGAAA